MQEYTRTAVIYIPYKYFTGIAYWEERSFKNVVCKFQISVTDKLAVRGNAEPSQLSSTCTPPSLTLSKQERGALAACDSSQFLPLLAPCCHRSEHNTQPGASSAAERCDTSSKATSRWHIPLPPLDRRLQGVRQLPPGWRCTHRTDSSSPNHRANQQVCS